MKTRELRFAAIGMAMILSFAGCSRTPAGEKRAGELLASLKADSSVKEYSASHDSEKVAVIRTSGGKDALSVVSVKGNGETAIGGIGDPAQLYSLEWSHDDRFFSVSEGTSIQRSTHVIDAASGKEKTAFTNTGAVWAGDRNRIAYAAVDETVPQAVETEMTGSSGVIVCDIETLKKKTVLSPSSRYLYKPVRFDGSGKTISIERTDLTDRKQDTITIGDGS